MEKQKIILDLKWKSTPQLRHWLAEQGLGYYINREKRTCEVYYPQSMETKFYNIKLASNYIYLTEIEMIKKYTYTREYTYKVNIADFVNKYNLTKESGISKVIDCFKDHFSKEDDEIFYSMPNSIAHEIVNDIWNYLKNL